MVIKITNIILGIIFSVGTMILLGFTIEQNSTIPFQKLEIAVDHQDGNNFIEAHEIKSMVEKFIASDESTNAGNEKLKKIEQLISAIPHVDRAHVYRTIDGAIHIRATQRQPLLRVINSYNDSYYIDINGRMVPLTSKYTARVIVATGHINSPYSSVVDLKQPASAKKNADNEKRIRGLFHLAEFIKDNPFWNAFIDQIYVTSSGEYELIPKNGSHIVEFGDETGMEEKFQKLLVFYQNGLTRVGWNHYDRVNIKYSNQIVCSK